MKWVWYNKIIEKIEQCVMNGYNFERLCRIGWAYDSFSFKKKGRKKTLLLKKKLFILVFKAIKYRKSLPTIFEMYKKLIGFDFEQWFANGRIETSKSIRITYNTKHNKKRRRHKEKR